MLASVNINSSDINSSSGINLYTSKIRTSIEQEMSVKREGRGYRVNALMDLSRF